MLHAGVDPEPQIPLEQLLLLLPLKLQMLLLELLLSLLKKLIVPITRVFLMVIVLIMM